MSKVFTFHGNDDTTDRTRILDPIPIHGYIVDLQAGRDGAHLILHSE